MTKSTQWKETNWFFDNLQQLQTLAVAHAGMTTTEPKDTPQAKLEWYVLEAVSAPMFVRDEEGEHARR